MPLPATGVANGTLTKLSLKDPIDAFKMGPYLKSRVTTILTKDAIGTQSLNEKLMSQ